jgi:hypothetical protein
MLFNYKVINCYGRGGGRGGCTRLWHWEQNYLDLQVIKLRMRFVARMGETRNKYFSLIGKFMERDHLGDWGAH